MDIKIVTDWIINQGLMVGSWLRSKGIVLTKQRRLKRKIKNYTLVVDDNFKNLKSWNKGLWWGDFHPNEKKWTKKGNVKIGKTGVEINTKPDIKIHEGREYTYSNGVIEHKDTFWYGYYEVTASVEPGKDLWHAPLWFVSKGNPDGSEFAPVVPEFDVCETYSDSDGSNLHSNTDVHYGPTYEAEVNLGAMTHYLPDLANRPVRYGMFWTKKKIEVYYDGWLVLYLTRTDLIKTFTKKLMPIIGSGVKSNKTANEECKITVHNFKFYECQFTHQC